MRYPMVRENKDGSCVVVRNPTEAYADSEQIARFLPDAPIPEEPAEEVVVPEIEEPAETPKRFPGRPKKVLA